MHAGLCYISVVWEAYKTFGAGPPIASLAESQYEYVNFLKVRCQYLANSESLLTPSMVGGDQRLKPIRGKLLFFCVFTSLQNSKSLGCFFDKGTIQIGNYGSALFCVKHKPLVAVITGGGGSIPWTMVVSQFSQVRPGQPSRKEISTTTPSPPDRSSRGEGAAFCACRLKWGGRGMGGRMLKFSIAHSYCFCKCLLPYCHESSCTG